MASITVLLLPDHERTSTLKILLPSSWRAKTVAALAKTLHRKHCASLGRDPSGEAALWSGGRRLDAGATLAALDGGRPLAVSLVLACVGIKPSTRLKYERTRQFRRNLFGCASRTLDESNRFVQKSAESTSI